MGRPVLRMSQQRNFSAQHQTIGRLGRPAARPLEPARVLQLFAADLGLSIPARTNVIPEIW
jgi:hypothetical protein